MLLPRCRLRFVRLAHTCASRASIEQLREAKALLSSLGGEGAVRLTKGALGASVGHLQLCNPARANALSPAMMVQLHDHVLNLEQWDSGRLVLLSGEAASEGAASAFCAGADLRGDAPFFEARAGAAMNLVMVDATSRLHALEALSVSVVAGAAIGGGAELALATDFRVLSESAFLQFVHTHRGVTPGWGGASRLLALIPRNKALWVLLAGEKVEAGLAAAIGLADAVFEAEADAANALLAHALRFAQPIAHLESPSDASGAADDGGRAVKGAKRVVAALTEAGGAAGGARIERETFCELWGGPEQLAQLARWQRRQSEKKGGARTTA